MQLSIIHLSDIHIKNSNDTILGQTDEISKACASCIKPFSKVVIVVSGDIAYSGEKEQYSLANDFLKKIENYIAEECDAEITIVVSPGNHDCDLSGSDSVRDTLIGNIDPEKLDCSYIESVTAIQNNYLAFASEYSGSDPDRMISEQVVSVGQDEVLFVSLNTAWMSQRQEKPGKLVMPEYVFSEIDSQNYKAVVYTFHHPLNWLNPDHKVSFVDHLRRNADIVLLGHEHFKDTYTQSGNEYELTYNHGKELQNFENTDSGFSVLTFQDDFESYQVRDYLWDGNHIYNPEKSEIVTFKRNKARRSVLTINRSFAGYLDDFGVGVRHFAKEDIRLDDLYIWPDLNKSDYKNEKSGSVRITDHQAEELNNNKLSIVIGESLSGKTSLGKQLYREAIRNGDCAILVDGRDFTTSTESAIIKVIDEAYERQYLSEYIEEFRQLPRENRHLIIDNFDEVQNKQNRRSMVLETVSQHFNSIIVLMSSGIEIATLLKSEITNSVDTLYYYEIRAFGNRKRKELISKWYKLNNTTDTDDVIIRKIEQAQQIINSFLGNGASFIPAYPLVLVSILQNKDAFSQSVHMSKYGFLYESLVSQSLASIEEYSSNHGLYNLDTEILSKIAFSFLLHKTTFASKNEIERIADTLCEEKLLSKINVEHFLKKMEKAKIIIVEFGVGEGYRFYYPYIFYYFAAKYIASHLMDEEVQTLMEHMSSNLHNEIYGNVVSFVCHFNSDQSIIDNVLLNAYETLDNYKEFDYSKGNPVFDDIKKAVKAFVPQEISSNDGVEANKDRELKRMDEIGINDGEINSNDDYIDDSVSEEEEDLASITAALKTIEVLGQILQNYPADISGEDKIQIISEMHKLGMRSVEAIIEVMGYLEKDLIAFAYEASIKKNPDILRSDVESHVRVLMNYIIAGMARIMIHQVARALSSDLLLPSVKETYKGNVDISYKLLITELKLNCLQKVNYDEVKKLRDSLEEDNEQFAKGILDSIVGRYLNYNRCDYRLRSRLCNLCGFSEKPSIASSSEELMSG